MITRIVVLKITRAFFAPKVPVEVMIGFFDERGRPIGSQLISADLLEPHIAEGDSLELKVKQALNLLLESPSTQ